MRAAQTLDAVVKPTAVTANFTGITFVAEGFVIAVDDLNLGRSMSVFVWVSVVAALPLVQ